MSEARLGTLRTEASETRLVWEPLKRLSAGGRFTPR